MKVVCISTISPEIHGYNFISGKIYIVTEMKVNYITDEDNMQWYYSTNLRNYFITLQKYRKLKLDKLNSL